MWDLLFSLWGSGTFFQLTISKVSVHGQLVPLRWAGDKIEYHCRGWIWHRRQALIHVRSTRKDRGGWRQGVSQSPASSIWPHLPLSPSPDSPFSPEIISGLTQEGRSLLDSVISRRSHPELCTWDQTLNTWVLGGEILCIWTLSIITNIKTCNVLDSSLCLHLEYLETKGKDDPLSVWGRPWRSKALAGITFRTGTRCSRMGTSLRSEWDTSQVTCHWGRNSLMFYLIVTATLLLGGGKEGEDGIGQNKTTYTIPTSCLRNV